MSLAISLHSELVKVKRTSALYLCLLAAAIAPLLLFFEGLDTGPGSPRGLPWNNHFEAGREMINLGFFPLYIILISTLLQQLEYRDKTWKQVLSSPQKLIHVFLAKYLVLHLLLLLFLVVYNVCLGFSALATHFLRPSLYEGGFSTKAVLLTNSRTYLLALGVSTVQFWLALRFRNFIVPIAIGFFLWFLAPLMLFEFKWAFADKYPYSFFILSEVKKTRPNIPLYQWYSAANAVVIFALAFWQFSTRKVKA